MKKEQEILEDVKKIKDVLVTSEEEKKQKIWVGWLISSFFVSITIGFFAFTMKKLNTNSKYPLFADTTIKLIAISAFLIFIIFLILLAIFLRKRYAVKAKNF